MKRQAFSIVVVAILIGLAFFGVWASQSSVAQNANQKKQNDQQKRQDRQALRQFMREKLQASDKILEGLCVGDFQMIRDGAVKLQQMSTAEKWFVTNDPIYRQRSAEFLRITKTLEQNAKDENFDAAALNWVETTMSCIECHRFVRATLIAD